MKISFIVKTVIFGFIISLISACGATTKSSDTSNDSSDSDTNQEETAAVTVKFQDEKYEIVPVLLDIDSVYFEKFIKPTFWEKRKQMPLDNFIYPLAQSIGWWLDPSFAFRNKQGQYLTFDNDGDYSDLCHFPFIIMSFNYSQKYADNKVGVAAVIKDLFDSHITTPFHQVIFPYGYEHRIDLKKYDTPEIRNALEAHYDEDIRNALVRTMQAWILYLRGEKDEIDFDFRNAIEKFIYDNEHPEYASFYKNRYEYNKHYYKYNNRNQCDVFPVVNQKYITITGEAVPKGTLIVDPFVW
ncbi:MAG: hypothetical protein K2H59_00175 [Muribaculaceae bacterium]|nr:hypothetical protein [Muribaculaceae bacterium]